MRISYVTEGTGLTVELEKMGATEWDVTLYDPRESDPVDWILGVQADEIGALEYAEAQFDVVIDDNSRVAAR
jgi:hypothetical protein